MCLPCFSLVHFPILVPLLLLQVLTKGFGFHLRDLCNATPLDEFVHIADRNVSLLTQEIICRSSTDWLNKAQSHFLSNLDFLKPIRVSLRIQRISYVNLESLRRDKDKIR